ncbi:CCA tRNA nucleotidyltransferase [Paenibacillus thermotolerans]|uniref:CCA tRNA nucleotidyltransferase n=1 Tax=Paenibacillus thermotolerans TaxID=3027807 RepID=UPI002368A61F|nr:MULTISPECIES: CCA tRNA nucleotidyltransferase [unclassified Paenibacillus]
MNGRFMQLSDSEIGKAGTNVLRRLTEAGYPAYFVGGCVRDTLLGRALKDIDIATAARPDEVMRLYPDAIPTGLQHGTVTVVAGGFSFEVTTFRTESEYGDGRRPDSVSFIDSIEGDLERRDFTMNAMALDADGRLVDPYGGQDDLAKGILRCVGEPSLRFAEDSLRMLRCVRFAAEYELIVDEATWRAVAAGAPSLSRIAMERVRSELERMVSGAAPFRALRLLAESGLLSWTKTKLRLPPKLGVSGTDPDPLAELDRLPEPPLRWALWFDRMKVGAADTRGVIDALRGSKSFGERIERAVGLFRTLASTPQEHAESAWKSAVLTYGKETATDWLPAAEQLRKYEEYRWAAAYAEHGEKWLGEMAATGLHELSINGEMLMAALHRRGGPWLSHLLKRLLFEAAMNRVPNETQALLKRAAEMTAEEGERRER